MSTGMTNGQKWTKNQCGQFKLVLNISGFVSGFGPIV